MAITEGEPETSDGKVLSLCRMPFWQVGGSGTSSSSNPFPSHHGQGTYGFDTKTQMQQQQLQSSGSGSSSVSSVAKSLLPTKRRLKLDPATKLYFPYEPGKQARSAITIKNIGKSHVAFKFQTTSPKSCYMRPPGATLAPGETIIATVYKFVEPPENNEKHLDQKCNVKFKIMSLKVAGPMEYVPELFDEQKEHAQIEQILRVVFLDVERPCPQMEKLKRQLAEADAALEAQKKPPEDTGPKIIGEGLVIDEWKERRERYLAQQHEDIKPV